MNFDRLRQLLIQKAIEGKLVSQKISTVHSENLIKQKASSPFQIPTHWRWTSLDQITTLISDGSHNPPPNTGEGIPVLSAKDINNGLLTEKNASRWTDLPHWQYEFARTPAKNNDLALGIIGASIGKIGRIKVSGNFVLQRSVAVIRPNEDIVITDFLFILFNSVFIQNWLNENSAGSAQKGVYLKTIRSIPVPLPTLVEQHHIVARLNELFAAIKQAEDAYTDLQSLGKTLRERILQKAIEGKLVPQLDEEPAVEQIGEAPAEKPFAIPEKWIWQRLGNIATLVRGGSPRPIKDFLTTAEDGINWIKISDATRGTPTITSCAEKIIPEGIKRSRFVHQGSLLLTNSMSYGYPYVLDVDGCIHDGWLAISDFEHSFIREFLYFLLLSNVARTQFDQAAAGAVVKNLNIKKVQDILIPVPPLAEQRRIVAKLNELLPLVDQMTAV